ncbi:hypothetical protein DFX77_06695 [Escherichia coli]|nr:hypothetical protein [Escherichia coli]
MFPRFEGYPSLSGIFPQFEGYISPPVLFFRASWHNYQAITFFMIDWQAVFLHRSFLMTAVFLCALCRH